MSVKYKSIHLKANVKDVCVEFSNKSLNKLKNAIDTTSDVFGKKLTTQKTSESSFDVLYDNEKIASYYTSTTNTAYCDQWYINASIYDSVINYRSSDFYHYWYITTIFNYIGIHYCKVTYDAVYDNPEVDIIETLKRNIFMHLVDKSEAYVRDELKDLKFSLGFTGGSTTDGYSIRLSNTIDFNKFDCRFFEIDGQKPEIIDYNGRIQYEINFQSDDNITIRSIADEIERTALKIYGEFQACYDLYEDIKSKNGGCVVYLDSNKYLAHRDMQPIANSSFLTMKCPYTKDILTINISKITNIRIQGMDEFHSNQVPALLG